MSETIHENPLDYRKEVASRFFGEYVRTGESCFIVGVAGGGMTRLVDFLVRPDVQAHYLAGMDHPPLLLKVDCNRAAALNDWGLREVMLTTLVEGCSRRPELVGLRPEMAQMRSEVITTQNPLLALRNLELAASILIEQAHTRIYFVLNAFDDLFHELPDLPLTNLRALRDAHKFRLNMALCMHQLPELLHPERHDKLSARFRQNALMVGHYSAADARQMIEQLVERRGAALAPETVRQIIHLSGGHAGLIQGIFNSLAGGEREPDETRLAGWLLDQSQAWIECQRVWDKLSDLEQTGLKGVVKETPLDPEAQRVLEQKHLVQPAGRQPAVFSPLFALFIRRQDTPGPIRLSVDSRAHLICIGARTITDASKLVFKLLEYLYRHKGEACRREEIIEALYGSQAAEVSDEALAGLVRQARLLIEPQDGSYQFLLTVRGVGYKLVDVPKYNEPDSV
jgi:hypothetical protein